MIGLVTGASQGLGLELVTMGLEKGYQMVAGFLDIPDEDKKLKELKKQYQEQLFMIAMDVTDEEAVNRASQKFKEHFDHLDFIVNNAGVLLESKYDTYDPIKELDIRMFRKTLEVNTVGPAIVLKAFIPYIYKAQGPCIINISSEAGHLGPGGYAYMAYSVSKHAINMYSQKIRNFLAETPGKEHIRLYMVHPGRMQTLMGKENAQILPKESAEGIYKIIEKTMNPTLEVPFINYKGEQMPY
jgi:NAD(P)-dependent dehydrogenase (short-subunit alcohol dehydrogenase family)